MTTMTPSQEQLLGQLRIVITLAGSVAATLGFVSADAVSGLTASLLDIIGLVMVLGSSAWSFYDKTRASLVRKVDEIAKDPTSPVVGVITANSIEGHELAASIPGSTTVPAGTSTALTLAKGA